MKKQAKQVKSRRKSPPSFWVVRSDRRKGAAIPKLPSSSTK